MHEFRSARQLPERGMAVMGERRAAGREHLLHLAVSEELEHRRAAALVDGVLAVIGHWREYADSAGVPAGVAAEIETELRACTRLP